MVSVGAPSGYRSSTCGYCSSAGERTSAETSRHHSGMQALTLSCQDYQKMIDRGWRRSGNWCYKPDLKRSCCPQYTIKLDALAFSPSKRQRKVLSKWNRYVRHGTDDEKMEVVPETSKQVPKPNNKAGDFVWPAGIHNPENAFSDDQFSHNYEIILEQASYTEEKYNLYEEYQREVHNDVTNTPQGFKRFLVNTPLKLEPIPYPSTPPSHLPTHYGSYHQLHRLNGRLVAVSVIDVLPSCISSKYFFYETLGSKFSFGKLSVMREAALAREIHDAGVTSMASLYLGFYIYTCKKMKYKGEYSPSYLADPVTYAWHSLEACSKILSKNRYGCFSNPDDSSNEPAPSEAEPDPEPPLTIALQLGSINLIDDVQAGTVFFKQEKVKSEWVTDRERSEVLYCVESLGAEISKDMVFYC